MEAAGAGSWVRVFGIWHSADTCDDRGAAEHEAPRCAGSGLQIAASLHFSLDGYLQTGTTLGAGWQPSGVTPCRVSDAARVFLPSQGLAVTEDARAGSGQAAWEAPAWLLGTPGCRESGHRESLGKVHHPRRRAPACWASTRAGEEAVGTEHMTACFAWGHCHHLSTTHGRHSPAMQPLKALGPWAALCNDR